MLGVLWTGWGPVRAKWPCNGVFANIVCLWKYTILVYGVASRVELRADLALSNLGWTGRGQP